VVAWRKGCKQGGQRVCHMDHPQLVLTDVDRTQVVANDAAWAASHPPLTMETARALLSLPVEADRHDDAQSIPDTEERRAADTRWLWIFPDQPQRGRQWRQM
jgi:hypothetical protein